MGTARILRWLGEAERRQGGPWTLSRRRSGSWGRSRRARAGFGARHLSIYRQAMDNWIALGEVDAAFAVLERSRARGFLALLPQRDLLLGHDRAEALEAERRRLGTLYARGKPLATFLAEFRI